MTELTMPETSQPASASYQVPNLRRGLQILELLLDYPAGLQQSEIAARLNCSKTSVYRITMTLVEMGYLVRNERTKRLSLSRKLVGMGSRALAEQDLMAVSVDVMNKLRDAVKETVMIGAIVEYELVILGQVLGSLPFKFSADLGTRLPLHTAAPSKAILAFLPEDERDQLLSAISFTRFNKNTITSIKDLNRELEQVRERGYGIDTGEQMTGIHCVAAPIFNRYGYPIASIWFTGPTDRIGLAAIPKTAAQVMQHAEQISSRLGHSGQFSEYANGIDQ